MAELAVVLVLMGIILTVALPRFGALEGRGNLKTAARRLAGLSLEAFSDAAAKSRPWFLCLDLDQRKAWLATDRPGKEEDLGRESRYYKLPGGVFIRDVDHPGQGLVKEGRLAFGYWPQGGSEPGTIHLKDDRGEEITIFLRPFLGRTEIKDGYLKEESP